MSQWCCGWLGGWVGGWVDGWMDGWVINSILGDHGLGHQCEQMKRSWPQFGLLRSTSHSSHPPPTAHHSPLPNPPLSPLTHHSPTHPPAHPSTPTLKVLRGQVTDNYQRCGNASNRFQSFPPSSLVSQKRVVGFRGGSRYIEGDFKILIFQDVP